MKPCIRKMVGSLKKCSQTATMKYESKCIRIYVKDRFQEIFGVDTDIMKEGIEEDPFFY